MDNTPALDSTHALDNNPALAPILPDVTIIHILACPGTSVTHTNTSPSGHHNPA